MAEAMETPPSETPSSSEQLDLSSLPKSSAHQEPPVGEAGSSAASPAARPARIGEVLRIVVAVSLATFLVTVPWLDLAQFSSRGEPREALVAQSILSSGSWILPEGYGGGVPSKPPFLHWCMAGFSLLLGTGVTELTARLPSALASLSVFIIFATVLARRGWLREALYAPLLLLCAPEWFRAGVTSRVDMVHSAGAALGLLLLYRWWERGLRGIPLVAIVALSCSVLAKGPIGILLPCGIFGAFLLLQGIRPLRFFGVLNLVIWPSLVVPILWYSMATFLGGNEFLHKVYDENFARFSGTMAIPAHRHGVWYLLGAFVLGALPLFGTLLLVHGASLRSFCSQPRFAVRKIKERRWGLVRDAWSYLRKIDPLIVFSLLVVVGVFAFYALPSSKRGVYLLTAYPFLALLAARSLVASLPGKRDGVRHGDASGGGKSETGEVESSDVASSWGPKRLLTSCRVGLGAVSFAACLLCLCLTSPYGVAMIAREGERDLVPTLDALRLALFFASVGLANLWVWRLAGQRRAIEEMLQGARQLTEAQQLKDRARVSLLREVAVMTWCLILCGVVVGFPLAAWRASERRAAVALKPLLAAGAPLYGAGREFYGLSFYLHTPILPLRPEDFKGGELLLIPQENLKDISLQLFDLEPVHDFGLERLHNSLRGVVLLRVVPRPGASGAPA